MLHLLAATFPLLTMSAMQEVLTTFPLHGGEKLNTSKCKQAHTPSRHIFPFFPTWLVIGRLDAPCHPSLPSIPEGRMPRVRLRDWCEVGAGAGDSD